HLASRLYRIIIASFGLIGFLLGWMFNSLSLSLIILGVGVVVSVIAVVPDWPMYNRQDLKWQPDPKGPRPTMYQTVVSYYDKYIGTYLAKVRGKDKGE
ncbi:microsomal signal peptidase 12kDa subunit, partial [Kipferlia bialata]